MTNKSKIEAITYKDPMQSFFFDGSNFNELFAFCVPKGLDRINAMRILMDKRAQEFLSGVYLVILPESIGLPYRERFFIYTPEEYAKGFIVLNTPANQKNTPEKHTRRT